MFQFPLSSHYLVTDVSYFLLEDACELRVSPGNCVPIHVRNLYVDNQVRSHDSKVLR